MVLLLLLACAPVVSLAPDAPLEDAPILHALPADAVLVGRIEDPQAELLAALADAGLVLPAALPLDGWPRQGALACGEPGCGLLIEGAVAPRGDGSAPGPRGTLDLSLGAVDLAWRALGPDKAIAGEPAALAWLAAHNRADQGLWRPLDAQGAVAQGQAWLLLRAPQDLARLASDRGLPAPPADLLEPDLVSLALSASVQDGELLLWLRARLRDPDRAEAIARQARLAPCPFQGELLARLWEARSVAWDQDRVELASRISLDALRLEGQP